MQFLGNLGIDIKLLIAQLINFGILLWLLTKFIYKPIIKKIEEDEAKLSQADVHTKVLEKQKIDFEEYQKDAKKRAQEIIKEAEKIAEQTKQRIQNEAEEEKQEVIKQIRSRLSDIENDKKK